MQLILIGLIKFYQKTLSLFIGGECRFYPTCSSYAIEAIQTHGSLKGSWLMLKRIARCHPLSSGGIDQVPKTHQCQHKH
ncbi:membrane protein insertion efficiency factor YidD [Aliikangiella sp. IMCC44653]